MASKQTSKPVKSSEDDILFDDLIMDSKSRDNPTRRGPINQSSVNFFSELAEEAARDAGDFEDSDVSEADPNDILKNLKDLDEMDADLFGPKKKPSSAPAKTKSLGNGGPKIDLPKLDDETTLKENKLSSVATSPARGYKKFTFNELDDPLADLLADLPDETKTEPKIRMQKTPPEKSILSPSLSPTIKNEELAPPVNTPKKREELMFDDDGDDLMSQLGFDHTKDDPKKEEAAPRPTRESGERVQRARTRLDEILERGTSPRHLDRPPTAERKDLPQPLEKQQQERNSNTKANGKPTEPFLEDDLTFGSYQPTLGSTPEGRRSRRQSVRFSTEDVSVSAPEKNPKPSTPVSATNPTPAHPRSAADWLSLKASDDDDFKYPEEDVKEPKSVLELPKPSSSLFGEQDASMSGSCTTPAVKMTAETAAEPNTSKPSQPEVPMGQKTDDQEVEDDWLTRARMSRKKVVVASSSEARQPKQEDSPSLGEELLQSSSLGGAVDRGYLQRRKEKEQQSGDLQARIIQLEGQVKTLQLERDQSQMLLESIQQRHNQDIELMENAHKARVKLLEEKAAQREARAHQECEDLVERLAMVTQVAEQECSELQAQHQRRLAQAQQDRDREVERLRDLQRKSILEMKKDYEDQVQRLKRLKDEEIDAVTSATSQTRSLVLVIEQMEQFSQRLGHISSRVESTHEHTAQGLEQGARQRDEQLRVMQDRLDQQQRAMVEERARLKELIARMDTQLAEQQRQLEKERWRVTAEQAKAESALRGLEEEKRSMTSHINMEREELERAKSALLEEQQSVIKHCAEERRKLATEWSHFHAQEKQRLERVEREASRAMERDAHREGNIISLAQEQADLRLRAIELKQKEEAALREREALDRQREELEREKESLSGTALRLKTRAHEVEAFSKLAAEKYEEGEQALQEARRVETEHQARLKSIHTQNERLRQQEQQLHQERLRMTELRRERLGQTAPLTPLPQPIPPLFTDFSLVLPNPLLTSTVNDPTTNSSPGSPEFQARLALLRHTAEKDRDYLQDEQFFLDTLKNTSYSSAFHTA